MEILQDFGRSSDGLDSGREVHHGESCLGVRAADREDVEGDHLEGELEFPLLSLVAKVERS